MDGSKHWTKMSELPRWHQKIVLRSFKNVARVRYYLMCLIMQEWYSALFSGQIIWSKEGRSWLHLRQFFMFCAAFCWRFYTKSQQADVGYTVMVVKAVKHPDFCVETQLKCLTDCCSVPICILFLVLTRKWLCGQKLPGNFRILLKPAAFQLCHSTVKVSTSMNMN